MAIFDLRGTNGAGKSHIPHTLMKQYHTDVFVPGTMPAVSGVECWTTMLHGSDMAMTMLGKYHTQCGGCDGISTQKIIEDACIGLSAEGANVLIEGSIVATVYTRWCELAYRLPNYVFCHLDTPLELCIERVKARRILADNIDEFDPYKTLVPRYRSIKRVFEKLVAAGRTVRTIDHTRSVESFLETYHEFCG
jgi:hypothetical protein